MNGLPPPGFSIESENFIIRPLGRADATPAMEAWTEDEVVVEMLNTTPRRWTVAEQVAYISRYDGKRTRYLLGIFPKAESTPIGFFIVRLRPHDQLMLVTHALGRKEWRGSGASREASIAIFDFFFNKLSYAKAKANVRPDNRAMQWLLLNGGWRVEARLQKHLRRSSTGERMDMLVFGILADDWRVNRDLAKTVRRRAKP
ncbi:GNAT family N-acetyltransferase [Taklimakanibacter lacteus]|uniref:GNAT family N-acetyltransferase n=1 Tax=Taklimakanibacter lacteus TaxID=2268456 RepID=UPI000E663B0A